MSRSLGGRRILWWILVWLLALCLTQHAGGQALESTECSAEPLTSEQAQCYYRAAKARGEYPRMISRAHEVLESKPDLPWLWFYLGHLYFDSKPCTGEAENAYRQAALRFADAGEAESAVQSRISLSWNLARCRQAAKAEHELTEAARLLGNRQGDVLLRIQFQLARSRLRMAQGGDLEAVYVDLVVLEKDLFQPVDDDDPAAQALRVETLRALGTLAYHLARYEEAQSWFERRYDLSLTHNDSQETRSAQLDIDLVRVERGILRGESALEIERRSRQILADAVSRAGVVAKAHLQLARMTASEEAQDHLTRCIELAAGQRDFRQVRRCRLALARLESSSDPSRARQLLSQVHAADAPRLQSDPWLKAEAWQDELEVLWRAFPRPEMWPHVEQILSAIEGLRRRQTGMARPDILHGRSDAFYWLAGKLLQESSDEETLQRAFYLMERLRAQDLREALGTVDQPLEPAPLPLEPAPDLLHRITAALADREAMVSFQIGSDTDLLGRPGAGAWVWVSTRQGTRVHRLATDRDALEAKIETLRFGQWQSEDLALLYRRLLAPAIDSLPIDIDRLVIIPDGALHLLPFAALGTEPDSVLAARYEITVVPSAALWQRWQHREPDRPRSAVLAFADPRASIPQWLLAEATHWPASWRGGAPRPLQHARREGKQVVRWVGGRSRLLQGASAEESRLLSADLESVDMLHFATHAYADTEQPRFSGVLLAPGEGEDGWLQPAEIASLELEGKVVVLSTCDSAAGAWRRGEGVISLARAFFEAGAQAVVGTLQPVPDDVAARFFNDFYRRLGSGDGLRSSLAGTQRQWIERGEPASHWAGIVVLGDGEWRLKQPENANDSERLVNGFLFLLFVAVLIWAYLLRAKIPWQVS